MNAALPLLSDCAGPLNRGWGEYITRQKGEQEQPKKKVCTTVRNNKGLY